MFINNLKSLILFKNSTLSLFFIIFALLSPFSAFSKPDVKSQYDTKLYNAMK